jgi:hypothetical protein
MQQMPPAVLLQCQSYGGSGPSLVPPVITTAAAAAATLSMSQVKHLQQSTHGLLRPQQQVDMVLVLVQLV